MKQPSFEEYQQKVQKAEEHISFVQNSRYALKLHLMPPTGWLNDPNGLCQKDGVYHIFFQYSPFDADGGEKLWGHYMTRDFVHYEYTGAPIAPDTPSDRDGVYSGCALTENGRIRLYYTGNVREPGTDGITEGREANTLYAETADGITVSSKKCLMTNRDYPLYATCHVRDPKVWKENGLYYMIQGARFRNNKGYALLFTSKNGTDWQYFRHLSTDRRFGYMWECPDLFTLEGKQFLSLCPQGLTHGSTQYQNIFQSGYFTVKGDFRNDYKLMDFREWDMGFDFYAPQTFTDEQNRRILIGWMGIPTENYNNPTVSDGWQHALTLPRELTLSSEGKILQNPPAELAALRQKKVSPQECSYNQITYHCPDLYELTAENNAPRIHISIAGGLHLDWLEETGIFSLSFSGSSGSGRTIRKAVLKRLGYLQIFADTSAVEVYLNHGELVFSTRFYPHEEDHTVAISCADCNAVLWELSPISVEFNNRFQHEQP